MSDITYEPTREHWTPYEPWMRDVLADDARVSWVYVDVEKRAPWHFVKPPAAPGDVLSGLDLRIHPDDAPERPAEDDPDEALAVVIDELVDDHGSTSEWADNEYITRSTALAIARVAREHIESEKDCTYFNRAQTAEAEVERLTRHLGQAEMAMDDARNNRAYWEQRAAISEAELEDSRAEVERLTRENETFYRMLHSRTDADGNALVTVRADDLRAVMDGNDAGSGVRPRLWAALDALDEREERTNE